jgi:hypothetical protein
MSTQTQPWLRAELIAAPETTPGAQLMIPADGIEFHDGQLVFHNQGDIVYVASQGQLRSITWLAKQPNPATARRRAQWPNHGTRWTDEEREDLLRRLQAGQAWKTISTAHGRSRSGCQQEAVKHGWLDAETLQLKPEFRPDAEAPGPTAQADDTREAQAAPAIARHATRSAGTKAPAKTPSQPGSTSHAAPSADGYTSAGAAPISTAEPPAEPQPSPAHDFAAAAPPATTAARATAASASASATPDPGFGSATPQAITPDPRSRRPSTDALSGSTTRNPGFGSATRNPNSSPPAPDALSSRPARSAIPHSEPPAPDTFSIPVASEAAMPNPDRPRFPPRVPRQRTNPDNLPGPGPETDTGPDSEPGPRPGSRFFSRAQSSLARATLGAYMTPPRGEAGAAPGAT